MKATSTIRRMVLHLAILSLLVACSKTHPEIVLDNLATRSTVNVSTRIETGATVQSEAHTRGEGAVGGVVGGAGASLMAGLETGDPFGLALGIVLMPVVATVGGVAGVAAGTSKSREEITRAVETLNKAYMPSKFEGQAEAEIKNALEQDMFKDDPPCFTTRSARRSCSQGRNASELNITMRFNLVPAASGAGKGNLDYLGALIMKAEPSGVLSPSCVAFDYRRPAGNIFDLAKNNGALLDRSFRVMLRELALGLPEQLNQSETELGADGQSKWYASDAEKMREKQYAAASGSVKAKKPKRSSGNWVRRDC